MHDPSTAVKRVGRADRVCGEALSGDGNFVAFYQDGISILDRNSDTISIISDAVHNDGCDRPAISNDGGIVIFRGYGIEDGVWAQGLYIHDRLAGTTKRFAINGDYPSISGDGRYVAFTTGYSDLVPDDTNDDSDVFVYDTVSETTEMVSLGPGTYGAGSHISDDGRFVAFESGDARPPTLNPEPTPADLFRYDRLTDSAKRITDVAYVSENTAFSASGISRDGRFIAFGTDSPDIVRNDANGAWDVFLFDSLTETTRRLAEDASSDSMSATGRYITYNRILPTLPTNDWRSYIFDRITGNTTRIEHGNRRMLGVDVSDDGRFVLFGARPRTVYGDLFLYDRADE